MTLTHITSKDNPQLKEYHKLLQSKSKRLAAGRFVLESRKLILEAMNSGVILEKVFVTQSCLTEQGEALQKLFTYAGQVFVLADSLEHKLTVTENAGGLFAIAKRLDKPLDMDTMKTNGHYLYLADLQDTGNVGTILRTAEALGVDGIVLSKHTCDIYHIKTLRASMGSAFRIPLFQGDDPAEDIRALSGRFATYGAVLREDAKPLGSFAFAPGSVIVIGNEGNGLAPEAVEACTHHVMIPMKGQAESFNAAVAAALLLWEMMK